MGQLANKSETVLQSVVRSKRFFRMAEIIVPLLSWTIITFPIWLSPFHPAVAAYLILGYLIYFLYKGLRTVYYATISYRLMERAKKTKWYEKIHKHNKFHEITHFFIITNYKESYAKVATTISKIASQNYDKNHVYVMLALEKKEGKEALLRAEKLKKRFKGCFADLLISVHELKEGEIVGKASNEAYSAVRVYECCQKKGFDPKKVIVTVSDADSFLPKDYSAYVTHEYLKDVYSHYRFYWAPVLLYNNFWKLSLPIRVQSILSSVMRLAFLSQRDDLIQISTYSSSLWLLHSVGYWDVDIIPEDWHIFYQAFFTHGEKVKTLPIFLPITGDPVLTENIFKTYKNRYEQEKRWAWGVTDIPYAIVKFFEATHIPIRAKLKRLLFLIEIHLLWPTSFFLLTLSGWIPPLVNPTFKRTVLGYLLPQMSSIILTLTTILLVITIYFDYKLRKRVRIKTKARNLPILFIQWYFLPIISFLFSSLPALEAHTRLILGKKIEYKVTEKV